MSDINYFRLAIFGWFVYLLIKGCCERETGNQNGEPERLTIWEFQNGRAAEGGGGSNNNPATPEERQELVRNCLEFRTISAPKTIELTTSVNTGDEAKATKDTETNETDLEKGDEPSSESSSSSAAAATATKGETNRDDAENDEPSDNNNNNSSVRSLITNIFQRVSRSDIDATNTSAGRTNNNEDDDPPITSNETQFSIHSLLYSMGLGGPDTRQQECCSICLEHYKVGDRVARMKRPETRDPTAGDEPSVCNHWFHEDCILEWLQNHDECPLCRVKMIHT